MRTNDAISPEPLDTRERLPSLKILESELDEFRRTGSSLHLVHAARALDDARVELRQLLIGGLEASRLMGWDVEPFDEH